VKPSQISIDDLVRLLDDTLPLWRTLGVRIDELAYGEARLTMTGATGWTRAGGTMAGPALMSLADLAIYAALLGAIGSVPLAVTSDLHVRFLRRAPLDTLRARAHVVHLGRRQAVCEVRMWHDDPERPVAMATGTYALPLEG
jgi:uncharacterized protein (TIGR00369 family)